MCEIKCVKINSFLYSPTKSHLGSQNIPKLPPKKAKLHCLNNKNKSTTDFHNFAKIFIILVNF